MPKIDQIETFILDIPTIRGHVLSMATMRVQSAVLVRIRFSDGSEGWGEGTTIGGLSYGGESPESIRSAIEDYIAPALLGKSGNCINSAIHHIEKIIIGNPIARSAVEIALWDGLARRMDQPLSQLFGGAVTDKLPVAWTLASGDLNTDVAEAEEMLAKRRHQIFKLKIGKRPLHDDLTHVAAIVRALDGRASIRVDVNKAWSLGQARYGLAGLQEMGCVLVEQPVGARNISAMAELVAGYKIAVMADEALTGPETAFAVASNRAADVFAIKVAQSGGLKRASEVAAIAQSAGLGLYGGTMLETGLGTAAALQLFAGMPEMEWGTEMFGPLLLTEDILTEPLVYADFTVGVPHGPGIGVRPDPEKIDAFRRDRTRKLHAVAVR